MHQPIPGASCPSDDRGRAAGGRALHERPAPGIPGLRRLVARLAAAPLVSRLAGGAFWNILGAGLSRALALVAAILVARQLAAAAFGEYTLVQTTAGMFQVLAGFGVGATATKYLSGRYRADAAGAGRLLALSHLVSVGSGAAATLVMALSAPWLSRVVLGAPHLSRALQVGSVLLFFGSVAGAQYGVLSGFEKFRLLATVSVISGLVGIPLVVFGARFAGVEGGVAGLAVATALTVALQAGAVRRVMREAGIVPRYREALREWPVLVSFGIPATLSSLLVTPVSWATSAVIAHQPQGWRELGLFSAANQWRNVIVVVAISASAAMFPVFSHLHDGGRSRALARTFWTSVAAMSGMALVATAVLSAAAPFLMRAYGPEFASATLVVVLMVATGALSAPLSVITNAIMGTGRMWLGFALTLGWACLLTSLTWLLRERGALGLSWAYLGATAAHLAAALAFAPWILHREPSPAPATEGGTP